MISFVDHSFGVVSKKSSPYLTCMHVKSLSYVWLFTTLWTVAHQALSMGFSRQGYGSGLPCPPPGNLPDPGIGPKSLTSPVLASGSFTASTAWDVPTSSDLWTRLADTKILHRQLRSPNAVVLCLTNIIINRSVLSEGLNLVLWRLFSVKHCCRLWDIWVQENCFPHKMLNI